jgi:hypothetical protein
MERLALWVAPALITLLLIILYYGVVERWLVLRLAPETAIDNVFQRFYRAARPIAGPWVSAETSSEFLHKLEENIRNLQSNRLREEIISTAERMTSLYHRSLFTENKVGRQDATVAWRSWKQLKIRLFGAGLLLKSMKIFNRSDMNRS